MPTITTPLVLGSTLSATEVEVGLFAPAFTPASLEVLNGGIEEANYGGGDFNIPTYTLQPGAYAGVAEHSFGRPTFVYYRRMTGDSSQPVVVTGFATQVFIPWDFKVARIRYRGLFCQDGTLWNAAGPPADADRERWSLSVRVNGAQRPEAFQTLRHGRTDTGTSGAPTASSLWSNEVSYRWVDKHVNVLNGTKGFLRFRLQTHMYSPPNVPGSTTRLDPFIAKLRIPSGRVSIVVYR